MAETNGRFIALLSCSDPECPRSKRQLEYYFNRADLREMVEEENEDVIICPGCRHTRVLTREEKDGIRDRFFAAKSQVA